MKGERAAAALATLTSLACGWLAMCWLVWAFGESPGEIAGQALRGTWGVGYGVGQVLYKATPLLFTGVAVDMGLRAGLFNIGAEGQLAVAGLVVGGVFSRLPPSTSSWVAVPAALALAVAAGALWALVPAALRARRGAHEVISTIMMNRVADVLVAYALAHGLALAGTVRTADVVAGARLARLDALGLHSFRGSSASVAVLLAVATPFVTVAWLRRSRVGRETLLVGMAPEACATEGIPVGRRTAFALMASGGIAGLAAAAPVLGGKGYYEAGLAAGAGFGGIAVAILGRGSPLGLMLAALFFGTLEQAGLAINGRVPMEIATVLEGVVVVAVSLGDARVRIAMRARASS